MPRQHDIEQLLRKHSRRLQKLKEQKATQGIGTPPDVLIEIEDIEEEIAQYQVELQELKKGKSESTPECIRVAMLYWEIGRHGSGLGTKIGGMGKVAEELPPALVKAAARKNINLDVELLTPCYPHHNKDNLTKTDYHPLVTMDGRTFEFEVYEYVFPEDGQKVVYFWDELELTPTNTGNIYPMDSAVAFRLFASMSQAMAHYIEQRDFAIVHIQDHYLSLVPFYLNANFLSKSFMTFTIHNASVQGVVPTSNAPALLDQVNLPGQKLFHKYFEFSGNLNLLKAGVLKVHNADGRVTTVSGDLDGNWGYAAALKQSQADIETKALEQLGKPPREVYVSNCGLEMLRKIPIAGITNGLSDQNRPENLPVLKTEVLLKIQGKREPLNPLFRNPIVQKEMLSHDHNFDAKHLHIKAHLKRLLHLEAFDQEPSANLILLTGMGRLIPQKNMGLIADVIERTLDYDAETKFIILASAFNVPKRSKYVQRTFYKLAATFPDQVCYKDVTNDVGSRLILAGGDFCLIPSQFEPCGLVDYEASLLGNIVVGHLTAGASKVRSCAYLYEWLDISDRQGEADAFFAKIREAIDTYRHNPAAHNRLVNTAMKLDTSWDKPASDYIELYLTGLRAKNLIAPQV